MTQNKTEEEVVNEVMEELVDFDGGNTTGGTVETNNISTNTENKSSGAESSKEETQLNNVAEAPKEVKLDNENTAEDVQSAEDKKETNGEGKSEEGDKEDHDSTSPPAEGEYEVETIVKHRKKKVMMIQPHIYRYGEDEMTWENADDLFCDDLVAEYWEKVKNQEVQANEGKKVSRSASKGKAKNTPPPIVKSENKRGRPKEKTDDNDRPRKQRKKKGDDDNDNWESQVVAVETVTRDDKTGELMVFLRWANGDTSKHPSKEANVKCPQQMIRFYEQRLTFAPPSTNKT
ncbi:hypothetical protein G9A89_005266 [Geosiphon pyriformis]|nr:hypothetical protein G9A89_005266 [Geosiphon pyriformis]